MSGFVATYLDGRSSKATEVTVSYDADKKTLFFSPPNGQILQSRPFAALRLEPQLGTTPRIIRLEHGGHLESSDFAAVAALERTLKQNQGMNAVAWLERHWQTTLFCLLGVFAAGWMFYLYAIPALAHKAALMTPPGILDNVSERTMKLLDERFLSPSKLSRARQNALQQEFQALVKSRPEPYPYKLAFRQGGTMMDANAFALPSGQIVMTDELVKLAHNDRELLAVLAHEIGHVEKRHSLQNAYEGLGMVFMGTIVLGDLSSSSAALAGLPSALIQSHYSRNFEREADVVAASYTNAQGWGTKPLRDILARLGKDEHEKSTGFLASHPATAERVAYLQGLEANAEAKAP